MGKVLKKQKIAVVFIILLVFSLVGGYIHFCLKNEKNTFTISFDANGGTGSVSPIKKSRC